VLDKDYTLDSNDVMLDNNQRIRADVLADTSAFFNGTSFDDSLVFAGVIAGEKGSLTDDVDWFSVYLNLGDTIDLGLSGLHDDLDLLFKGPANSNDDLYTGTDLKVTNSTGTKAESASLLISLPAQYFGVDSVATRMSEPLKYWIGVQEGANFKLRSSYILNVKIRKH